jgi:Ca-activated chloride channel family protein
MRFGALDMTVWFWMVPIVILFYLWSWQKRAESLRKFADLALIKEISGSLNKRKRKLKNSLIVFAVFLIVLALVRPQWGFKWQEVKRQGLDVLIALDTSKSMLAEDVLPNRLERSKLAIKDLVKKLHGDRVGLIAFSGTAFLQCPLTVDYEGFLLSLEDISVNSIPVGGTSLSKAIYTGLKSYEGGKKKNKILIIITDGEDLEGGVEGAAARAKSENVVIYCVGIGTEEGEIIPVRTSTGRMEFVKDSSGNVVKTRLNEDTLQDIALQTGGMYVRSTGVEFGLGYIYEKRLSKLEKEEFKARMEKQYFERFQLPLLLAFLLLLLEPLIGDRRKDGD